MFPASILLGLTILGFAAWLEWRERQLADVPQGFDDAYLRRRRRGRSLVHVLLALAGLLVLIAAFVGRGMLWVALWSAVCGLLVLVVVVAMLDLWRTNRYFYRKLPEMRRQMLGSTDAAGDEEAVPSDSAAENVRSDTDRS